MTVTINPDDLAVNWTPEPGELDSRPDDELFRAVDSPDAALVGERSRREKIIEAGLPEGSVDIDGEHFEGRNAALFEWVCARRDAGLHIDHAVALAHILNRNNRPPLDDHEVIRTVRSAYNYEAVLAGPTSFEVVDEPVLTNGDVRHRYGWAELHDIDFPEPQWVVEHILPEGLTLLIGKSKVGKSWLGLQLGVGVATGTAPLGPHGARQGDVWFYGLEDTIGRLKGRLRRFSEAGATPTNALQLITRMDRLTPDRMRTFSAELHEARAAGELPRLIVIDILNRVKPSAGKNSNLYDDDAAFMSTLQSIAHHYEIAMLVIHHARKIVSADPMDDVLGTTAIAGGADMILALLKDRGTSVAKLSAMGREAPEAQYELEWNGEACTWDYLGKVDDWGKPGRPPKERASAREWLSDILSDGEWHSVVKVQEAFEADADAPDVSWRTIERAASDLEVLRRGQKTSREWGLLSMHVDDEEAS